MLAADRLLCSADCCSGCCVGGGVICAGKCCHSAAGFSLISLQEAFSNLADDYGVRLGGI